MSEKRCKELPASLMDLKGIAPNCTGDMSSEDFVRQERGPLFRDADSERETGAMSERPPGYHVPPPWRSDQGIPRQVRCWNCRSSAEDATRLLECWLDLHSYGPVDRMGTCDRAMKNVRKR